jgi:hypothetical protein
MLEYK